MKNADSIGKARLHQKATWHIPEAGISVKKQKASFFIE
jgi:hypothetical protein